MSSRPDPHAGESMVGPHGAPDDHGDTHGHDDHAHASEEHGSASLGPLDLASWGMAVLGIVLGLAVAVAFMQSAA